MSTDLPTETSPPSPPDGEPTPDDAHAAAATFDPSDTRRLPNTVDAENQRVG